MQAPHLDAAIRAAISCATDLGLAVDDATVLRASNRVTVRLLPCDTVARVAPLAFRPSAEFEIELAQRLAEDHSPVAALEPRVEPRAYMRWDRNDQFPNGRQMGIGLLSELRFAFEVHPSGAAY